MSGCDWKQTMISTMIEVPRFTFLQPTPSVRTDLLLTTCRAWWKGPVQGWQQCLIKHAAIQSSALQELQQVDTSEQVSASFCTVMPCISINRALFIPQTNLLLPVCAELGLCPVHQQKCLVLKLGLHLLR